MKKLLMGLSNSTVEDQATLTDILQSSDALKVLVDDSALWYVGNMAVHPGSLTKKNVEGYKTAVQAAGGTSITILESCITFLFFYVP